MDPFFIVVLKDYMFVHSMLHSIWLLASGNTCGDLCLLQAAAESSKLIAILIERFDFMILSEDGYIHQWFSEVS
jgi:hypothetical protein